MTLRYIFILLLISGLHGCSGDRGQRQVDELSVVSSDSLTSAEIAASDYSIVCGVLFKVNDFDLWESYYQKNSHNLIIYLRSIDDPNIIVLFEGNNNDRDAIDREDEMMREVFNGQSGMIGSPVLTYYNVKYFEPGSSHSDKYLGLSFTVENIDNWQSMQSTKIKQFRTYGLTPIGVGANSDDPKNIYILLSLQNTEQFREQNNSPGEINHLLESLNLPANTVLSYWYKP